MALTSLRKKIEEIFIITLREIFKNDTEYTYDEDDLRTNIVITPPFPKIDQESKVPHMILENLSYSISRQSLFNNFEGEVRDSEKRVIGFKYSALVPFTTSIAIYSTVVGESEDLADYLFNLLNSNFKKLFQAQGLLITDLAVSSGQALKQYPQYEFSSVVAVQGELRYTWEERPTTEEYINTILKNIKLTTNT